MTVLHENASPRTLAIFRAALFGLWAVKLLFDPLQQLANLPIAYFRPPAPLGFLPASMYPLILTGSVLIAFRVIATVMLLLAASGRFFLWTAPVCCLLLTIYQSLVRGFGHLNHAEIVPLLAVYAITIFDWADRLAGVRRPAYPLIAIIAMQCITYSLVGTYRVVHNGLGFFLTNAIEYHLLDTSLRHTYFEFALGPVILASPWLCVLLRIGFAVTTGAEILAPFCLVSQRFRIAFLLVMVPFHVLSLLAMNISFIENLLLMLLLIDFSGRQQSATAILPLPHSGSVQQRAA